MRRLAEGIFLLLVSFGPAGCCSCVLCGRMCDVRFSFKFLIELLEVKGR